MVEILPIPKIREELKIAAKAGKLVPFIGAGASMLAGAPSWNGFADAAIKFFVAQGKFNLSQFEQLKHLSPRIKLSIAKSLQEKHGIGIDFEKILHPQNHPDIGIGQRLYGHLSALSKTFVTTNYDRWLAKELPVPNLDPAKMSKGEESDHLSPAGVVWRAESVKGLVESLQYAGKNPVFSAYCLLEPEVLPRYFMYCHPLVYFSGQVGFENLPQSDVVLIAKAAATAIDKNPMEIFRRATQLFEKALAHPHWRIWEENFVREAEVAVGSVLHHHSHHADMDEATRQRLMNVMKGGCPWEKSFI